MDEAKKILREENILSYRKHGVLIASVANNLSGLRLAETILRVAVTKQTLLLLSGGRTPKELYSSLARHESVHPGAVALVDERFGPKMHEASNEKMMQDSGILRYFSMLGIPLYLTLQSKEREETAKEYDETIRDLLTTYTSIVAVLGIGLDGHTAGIAGNTDSFTNPLFASTYRHELVGSFNDEIGMFNERVTLTFLGLSRIDFYLVLVFGNDKRQALDLVFSEGSEEQVPGRFYTRPEIAKKTLFITDQKV